ncbi:MAG: SBBP repeat-containing protein [Vicingaceae bacterium]|nr:SBBP repeat-containing protein [Vicingaceae bacterium]
MKKKITTFLFGLVFILHNNFYAQDYKFEWAVGIRGSVGNDGAEGRSIGMDAAKNVYTMGQYSGNVAFVPTPGLSFLYASGYSTYIYKQDSSGNDVWLKTLGIVGKDLSIDSLGNSYICGFFTGTKDFDPGPGVVNLTSSGNNDCFVLKLDSNGVFVWAKTFGGTSSDDANSIAIDSFGNIYLTGFFTLTVDFDPGVGVYNLTALGGNDLFIQKLDSNGDFIWAKSFGGAASTEVASAITVDNLGNPIVVGYFENTVDFDPSAGVFNLASAGDKDVFLLKLDTNGNFTWARAIGGAGFSRGESIFCDKNNNILITGYFDGTVDFDPGLGTTNIAANGLSNCFIEKLDNSGNFVWVKVLSGGSNFGGSIYVDDNLNVYTTGSFYSAVDFNPGPGTQTYISKGGRDIFILKLDAIGNYLSVITYGKFASYSIGKDIIVDQDENIYATGKYNKDIDFDHGPNTYILNGSASTSSSSRAAYVTKIYYCPSTYSSIVVNQCAPYTAPSGAIYTSDGIYTDIIPNSKGCDSIITINFTDKNSLTFMTIDRCSSYTVPSGTTTYTSTGTYTVYDTLTNAYGCDSILNILLSINDQYFSTNGPICDSILNPSMTEWITTNGIYYDTLINIHGCNVYYTDTIQVYQTAYGTNTMSGCESVTSLSGNQIWTTSGTYQDTIITVGPGYCDSIITTTVTINNHSYDTLNPIACYKYISPLGNTYYNSGTYTNITQNSTGCDSVLIINLTILQPSSGGYDSIWVACAPYLSNTGNQTWISSGTYTDTLYNANSVGCDSVFTVYLTIPVSNIPTLQAYTCDTFVSYSGNQVWAYSGLYTDTIPIPNQYGCDSIIKVNLTKQTSYSIMNVEFCGPANYLSPAGNTYTTSGIYYDTLQNHLGCDSIITVNVYMDIGESYISKINNKLHIYFPNLPPNYYSPNIESQVVLCLTTPWAYNNWEHVNSSNPIANVVVPSKYEFNTRVNLKTNPNIYCYNNIPCHDYTIVGINEHDISEQINVYPNPTDGIVNIDLGKHYSEISINLNDIVGKNIINKTLQNMTLFDIDIQNLPKGVYFMHLLVDDKSAVVKIVKN